MFIRQSQARQSYRCHSGVQISFGKLQRTVCRGSLSSEVTGAAQTIRSKQLMLGENVWTIFGHSILRASSSNVWEIVSVGQSKSFQSHGIQHGRRVIKAHRLSGNLYGSVKNWSPNMNMRVIPFKWFIQIVERRWVKF